MDFLFSLINFSENADSDGRIIETSEKKTERDWLMKNWRRMFLNHGVSGFSIVKTKSKMKHKYCKLSFSYFTKRFECLACCT
jgi:hypothetical protein